MRIEQLEYFLSVARHGSLSQAAENLYVGQPTLSAAIASMEKELGRKLFVRTRRGMKLTPLGEDILPLAERTVDDFYAMRRKAGTKVGEQSHLSVVSAGFGQNAMLDAIIKSRDVFSEVQFCLQRAIATEVLSVLLDKCATIGLTWAPEEALSRHTDFAKTVGMRVVPIKKDYLTLCVPTSGRFSNQKSMNYETLLQEPLVIIPRDLRHAGEMKAPFFFHELSQIIVVDDMETLKRLVLETGAPAITSALAMVDDPLYQMGLLRNMNMEDAPIHIVHYLSYLKGLAPTDVEADVIQGVETYFDRVQLS